MRFLCVFLFAMVCVLAGPPAWAAIELVERVEYMQGAKAEEACTWESAMLASVVANSRRLITMAKGSPASPGLELALQVTRLRLTRGSKKSEYAAVVRANVLYEGQLLATQDLQNDESFDNDQSACEALRALGESLGEDVSDWVTKTRFVPPAWAAIELVERVDYLQEARPDETCAWEPDMLTSAVANSKRVITMASNSTTQKGLKLALRMLQLKLSRGFRKSEYVAIVRADVSSEGKLLATRHFRNNESYVNDKPACPALRALGRALGEDVAEWGSQVRLMECRDGCDGIHPDETIVVGAEVLPSAGQAINAALLDECRWPSGMVDMLVKSVKEEAGPLSRTRLEARAIDIQTYPGRRLLLRLTSVRALGGSAFTGPKWLNMSGELWDGQSMVANFESHTHAVTGHTTCRALNGLSGDTAKLIAHWLHNPTLGAELK